MVELALVFVALIAVFKGLERWGTALVVRYRPEGLIDPTGVGIEAAGQHGGFDSGC
jgi:hypothetical protein